MQSAAWEEAGAMLCLLTRAAWTADMPAPMTRRMVHEMKASGALKALVLRGQGTGMQMERARALLARVHAVCSLLEGYMAQGYSILLPGDARWPQALYALGDRMPLFLFALGDTRLLEGKRIAAAGSRDIRPETRRAAQQLGEKIAREGYTLVTGDARGVDAAALRGQLAAGGSAVIVPATPDFRALEGRRGLMERGRLLLLCDDLPDSPFSAGKALSRNHTIYALGEAAVVAAAREGAGGSWRGAADCLQGGFGRVLVMDGGLEDQRGCRALRALGAQALDMDRPFDEQTARQTSFLE